MLPAIETASIIGLGQIGGSLAMALKKAGYFPKLGGFDSDKKRRQLAASFLDQHFETIEDAFEKSDLLILATPVGDILHLLEFGFQHYPQKLYSDVGSAKQPMMKLAAGYKDIRFVGGHPLAGSEKSGESGWDETLFEDKPYFYVPAPNPPAKDVELLVEMIRAIKAVPHPIAADVHDRALAATSHLPLLFSLSVMSTYMENEINLQPFLGGGFKSVVRLSGGSPEMGRDLLLSNRENILSELNRYRMGLTALQNMLETNNEGKLLTIMEKIHEKYWLLFPEQAK